MDLRRSGLGLDAPRSGPATRALLSVLLVAALGTLAAPGAGADDGAGLPGPSRPEPGARLPPLTLTAPSGEPVQLEELRATSPLLLIYLHPSQRLSGRLLDELLAQPRHDAVRPVVVFVGQVAGPTRARALANPAVRVLIDPGRTGAAALGIVAFPTAYVVDRDGTIAVARRGYTVSLARELNEELDVALGLLSADELARRRAGSGHDASPEIKRRHRRLRLAQRCLKQGQLLQALAVLEALVQSTPRDPEVRTAYAITLHRLERPNAAAALRAARALSPEDPALGVALAEAALATGRIAEAEELARRVLAKEPGSGRAHFVLGEAAERREEWERAAQAFRAAALAGLD